MSKTQAEEARKQLWSLFNEHEEYIYRINPEGATYQGIHKYDHLLSDVSEKNANSFYETTRKFFKRLLDIDYNLLSNDDKLNYDIFKHNTESSLESEPFKFHCTPLWQQDGIQINFPMMAAFLACGFPRCNLAPRRIRLVSRAVTLSPSWKDWFWEWMAP